VRVLKQLGEIIFRSIDQGTVTEHP